MSAWFRVALGVVGLAVVAAIVAHVGAATVLATLRAGLPWLPLLCLLELLRIVCEATSSALAFGDAARKIPRATLLRAHVLGHSFGAVAPAPTAVNETIKATLLAPLVGAEAAAAVGLINQAAIWISIGVFAVPCSAAIFALVGPTVWFWVSMIQGVVMIASGVGLRALSRADAPGRWLARRIPRLAARAAKLRERSAVIGLFPVGPSLALIAGRCAQLVQLAVAARAIGIDVGLLGAFAVMGVNQVAAAVGVLVPAGLGTTDGAFALAAGLLGTTAPRAAALALLIRCTQIVWVAIASVLSFGSFTRARAARRPAP